jgi:hypothetical protein
MNAKYLIFNIFNLMSKNILWLDKTLTLGLDENSYWKS